MSNIKSVTVFCGSKTGKNPAFAHESQVLAKQLAAQNIKLIYGGGNVGLMGVVATTVMNNGGTVIGIIPKLLVEWEQQHNNITELIIVDDMHDRKKLLYEMGDAAIILPGGNGTLDELFEMLTWNTLKIHEKKVVILNIDGFYNHLIEHLEAMHAEGFLYEDWRKRIAVCSHADECMNKLMSEH